MSQLSVTLQRRDPPLGVVVDLSDATFIDSQTLSVLLATRHCAQESDLGFTVVLPDEGHVQVHRLLDVTGLKAAFAVFAALSEACDAARSGVSGGGRVHAGS